MTIVSEKVGVAKENINVARISLDGSPVHPLGTIEIVTDFHEEINVAAEAIEIGRVGIRDRKSRHQRSEESASMIFLYASSARWCGRDWAGVVRAGAARDSVF